MTHYYNNTTLLRRHRHSLLSQCESGGFTIIETLVAIAIIVGSLFGFFVFASLSTEITETTLQRQEAAALAQESVEVVRLLRDESWSTNITPLLFETPYYPVMTGGSWELSTTPLPPIDGRFERDVRLFRVFRDANDDIAPSGTEDPDTRFVRSTVSWEWRGQDKELVVEVYLTNWREKLE